LERDLKIPVNVVLRPGGSGAVGHTAIAQAAPDGYTWGLATVEITMMHWQKLAPIQPKDFTVAAIINADAGGLIVRTESPYKSAKELLDDIKAKPASTFKASGTGQRGIWQEGAQGRIQPGEREHFAKAVCRSAAAPGVDNAGHRPYESEVAGVCCRSPNAGNSRRAVGTMWRADRSGRSSGQ
jgi:putative tricarboxylic transport membrane protein